MKKMQIKGNTDMPLIDSELLAWKEKALAGDPEGILKIADAYWLGEGAPYDPIKAGDYYRLLAETSQPLPSVEHEYLQVILGDVSAMKKDWIGSVEHYKKAHRLFIEKHGRVAGEAMMEDIGFLDRYQESWMKSSLWPA
jgi:TPR repeat protein